jgi:AraC-like DNA-binding protein
MIELRRAVHPYRQFQIAELSASQPPGAILAFHISESLDAGDLRRLVDSDARVVPSAALVAILTGIEVDSGARVMADAAIAGIPVILSGDRVSLEPKLREVLTAPAVTLQSLRHWLPRAANVMDAGLVELFVKVTSQEIERVLPAERATPYEHRSTWRVAQMAEIMNLTPRGLHARCVREDLPGPGRWRSLARILAQALVLQRHPAIAMSRLAYEFGYPDLPGMYRDYRRHVAVTPSYIRERLGWQWIAWKWLQIQRQLT